MRVLGSIASVLLALVMATAFAGTTAAQDAPAATPEAGAPEGLEKWYVRNYNVDLEAMFATPTEEAAPDGWLAVSANVVQFETEEQATAATDDLLGQLADVSGGEGIDVADLELDTRLDATVKVVSEETELVTTSVLQAVAQDGDLVYLIAGFAAGEIGDAELVATMLDTMADAEVGDGDETFDPAGGSEGGLWDKLPAPEVVQDAAPALAVVEDAIYYPAPAPEATPAP